jgi:hypothetical protein
MIRRYSLSIHLWNKGAIDNYSKMSFIRKGGFFPPLCMDCKYYLQPFASPHFPNASCERFEMIMPCMEVRSNDVLCGWEGKKFESKSG